LTDASEELTGSMMQAITIVMEALSSSEKSFGVYEMTLCSIL
jgi:hypothetical protein